MPLTADRVSSLVHQAHLVGTWGGLLQAGVPEREVLRHLAGEARSPALRRLAVAAAEADEVAAAVDREGAPLDAWVGLLLGGAPGEVMFEAAELLVREAQGEWHEGLLWARLRLLHRAQASPGDALGVLAREAREHERPDLAEAFNGAARRARAGEGLLPALRSASWPAGAGLVLEHATADGLADGLAALERLAVLGRAPLEPGLGLSRIAEAASAGAAPLRRGLERVLSGLEGALGLDRPADDPRTELAREAVRAREAKAAPGRGGTTPAAPAAEAAPPPEPKAPGRKTIGADSGPVVVNELHQGAADDAEARRPRDPGAWREALDAALGKMALLELQPDEADLGREVEVALGALRAQARGLGLSADDLERLAGLETRYRRWQGRG